VIVSAEDVRDGAPVLDRRVLAERGEALRGVVTMSKTTSMSTIRALVDGFVGEPLAVHRMNVL
jgi:hypothetical protein